MTELAADRVDRRRDVHLGMGVDPAVTAGTWATATGSVTMVIAVPPRQLGWDGTHSQTTDKTVMGA